MQPNTLSVDITVTSGDINLIRTIVDKIPTDFVRNRYGNFKAEPENDDVKSFSFYLENHLTRMFQL